MTRLPKGIRQDLQADLKRGRALERKRIEQEKAKARKTGEVKK